MERMDVSGKSGRKSPGIPQGPRRVVALHSNAPCIMSVLLYVVLSSSVVEWCYCILWPRRAEHRIDDSA